MSMTSSVHMYIHPYDKLRLLGLIQDPWRGNRKPSLCFYDLLIRPPLTIPVISGLRDWCHMLSVGWLSFCRFRKEFGSAVLCLVLIHAGKKGLSLYQTVPPSLCLKITGSHFALSFCHCLAHWCAASSSFSCAILLCYPASSFIVFPLACCQAAARLLDEASCRRNVKIVLPPLGCVDNFFLYQ